MADQTPNPARNLTALWAANEARFKESRDLIADCAEWELQHRPPVVPVQGGVPQGFAFQMPQSTLMPQDVASFVSRRQPSMKRNPLGSGTRANNAASKVESFLEAAFKSKIQIDGEPLWDTLCAFGTHDAEYAVIVQPAPSHYSGLVTLYEDDGKTIRAEWLRNAQNMDLTEFTDDGGKGFRSSPKKSREAQQSYARDYKARRWPIVVRVLSAPEYLPLGRDPLTGRLDTLLVRSVCSATHLKTQGFDWWTLASGGGSRESNVEGAGKTYWLYELHHSNPWTIVYQIVGMDGAEYQAEKDGQAVQLGLDMGQQYGIQQLPAGVFYGWHRPHEKDPARRGIPLLAPFRGILGAANRSLSGIVEHNYETGYGGWGIELNPDLLEAWRELGMPKQFDLQDRAIHTLLGRPTSLVHQGVGQDAWRIFEFLAALVERFNESERVRTSPDASSIAQTTSLASADTVLSQIGNGALQAMKMVAECVLEQVAVLSDEMGAPIPVYCTLNKDGQEQTHVELSSRDLQGDFTIDVEQPTKKGSNLPKAQAGISWMKEGAISLRTWLEDFYGEEQPEHEMDLIASEQYITGPEGQKQLGAMVSRILGDRDAQTIRGLQDAGKLTEGGNPSSMVPPRPTGGGGASGTSGNRLPLSQAQASNMGTFAAAVNPGAQTQVVTATGTGAETAVP